MRNNIHIPFLLFFVLIACVKRDPWHDIDYSSVYQYYKHREIDTNYTPPSILGCVDEDLYNCQ